MTGEERRFTKVALREAVERGDIRAWSMPAPNVWYIDTGLAVPEMTDEYVLLYAQMLSDAAASGS